jgi:peptide/nickel transport system ATP-binding protein
MSAPVPATPSSVAEPPVFSIRDLAVEFHIPEGRVQAVNGVSLDVRAGETLGVVGESGSGKSVTMLGALGLLPSNTARVPAGEVLVGGQDLLTLSEEQLRQVRGNDVGMIFQDPMTSLNPVFKVGQQLVDALRAHDRKLSRRAAWDRGVQLLGSVGVPNPHERCDQYPLQFSGGMRQRAMIALAIANNPSVLIADEPTTALDVTVQAQVLAVLKQVQTEHRAGMILITHDLGVVAEQADRVAVMYAGRIVEQARADLIYRSPMHPYFLALLASRPSLTASDAGLATIPGAPPSLTEPLVGCAFRSRCALAGSRERCGEERPELRQVAPGHLAACHFAEEMPEFAAAAARKLTAAAVAEAELPTAGEAPPHDTVAPRVPAVVAATSELEGTGPDEAAEATPALTIEGLVKHYSIRAWSSTFSGSVVHAVDGIDLSIMPGETLGLVGESGCGKTTVGKCVMRLEKPTAGRLLYRDTEVTGWSKSRLRKVRSRTQIVFQDPYSSLNPRVSVRDAIADPLIINGDDRRVAYQRVDELLEDVGLSPRLGDRYPHEFSGGQRQRVAIARSLTLRPDVIVLDEPVSSLDVSAQAQVLNLLERLRDEHGLALLFISHDLSVVKHISDTVAVMYLGKIVEVAQTHDLYARPAHPYTSALLSAVPVPDPNYRDRRERIVLAGDVPDPTSPPSGCRFRTRCWKAEDICAHEEPPLLTTGEVGHLAACHFPDVHEPPVATPSTSLRQGHPPDQTP